MSRDDGYLADIVWAAKKVIDYCAEQTFEQFELNEKDQSAALYKIAVIGEAARLLSDEFKLAHSEIPWTAIKGFRNRVIHEYRKVRVRELWNVVQRDLPELIVQLEATLPKEPGK